MTQALVATQLRPQFREDSGVITIPAAGNTVISTMILQGVIQNLAVSAVVAVNSLDGCLAEVHVHPDGAWVTLTSSITTTPAGLILAASGTLASQAAGTGWFIMDARGIFGVRVSASGTVADTTTVRILAMGS